MRNKLQQLPYILHLYFRKTRAGKSQVYHTVIVFKKLRFQNGFRPIKRKAGDFKFVRFKERFRKASFRDGLVWTRPLWTGYSRIIYNS